VLDNKATGCDILCKNSFKVLPDACIKVLELPKHNFNEMDLVSNAVFTLIRENGDMDNVIDRQMAWN